MLKRKQNKKKKGFTLIELVIVLAVLAIIALIAIPNFTKVRNDSMYKADIRSAEQIRKITLMAIANNEIAETVTGGYTLEFNSDKSFKGITGLVATTTRAGETVAIDHPFEFMLKDVKKPQMTGATGYKVAVDAGSATVSYVGTVTVDGKTVTTLSE